GAVSWVLEYALGADPADASFHTIASGTAKGPLNGKLGTLDLGQIPPTFYEHPPLTTLQPDGSEQYSVSLRLRVVDANGLKGEDRRSVGLRHDPSLVDGAPKRYGAEISGAPTYSDIEGHHQLDLVFSTYDGDVHALRPSGKEAPGFPVHSDTIASFDPMAPENLSAPAYANHPDLRNQRDPLSGLAGARAAAGHGQARHRYPGLGRHGLRLGTRRDAAAGLAGGHQAAPARLRPRRRRSRPLHARSQADVPGGRGRCPGHRQAAGVRLELRVLRQERLHPGHRAGPHPGGQQPRLQGLALRGVGRRQRSPGRRLPTPLAGGAPIAVVLL